MRSLRGGERAKASRTGQQVLRSVVAYLEWRSGQSWNSLTNPDFRNDQDRWDYLSAIRLVESVRFSPPSKPTLLTKPPIDRLAVTLCNQPRAWLVSEILRADSTLTDRRLLSRLSRPKLARMLMDRVPRLNQAASLRMTMGSGKPRQIQRVEISDGPKAASA